MAQPVSRPHADLAPDFRALFESAPQPYLVLDPHLKIVAVSDAYCRATMTSREGLLGQGIFDVFPDNPHEAGATGVQNLRASLLRVLELGRPDAMAIQKYDIPRPAAEGGGFEERHWSPLNTPVLDAEGKVAWIIHRVEDVTEYVRVHAQGTAANRLYQEQLSTIDQLRAANRDLAQRNEEKARLQEGLAARTAELQRANAFHDLVIENIPAMVFVKDAAEHRFLLVNRAGEKLLGVDRSELLGKNDYDFFPKEQADHFVARDNEVFRTREPQDTPEENLTSRDKGVRLIHTQKIPVFDEKGRPQYLVALVEDITERKKTEVALQASEAKFRSLLAARADSLVIVDADGRIALASDGVRTMFGYSPDEIIGKPLDILLPERFRRMHHHHVRGFAAAPRVRNAGDGHGLFGLRKDGTEFPAEVTLSPYNTTEGLQVIAGVSDISDRRAVEDQLRHAQKMEAIGNLTGGLAHDFNNLLGIVIGNLDLLTEQLKTDPATLELANEALEAGLRGADLTQRLLAFARRQPLQPVRIDVNELVTRISRLLGRTLAEHVDITLDTGADVWPVVADPSQLEASIVNIANNARDAMPKGGSLIVSTSNRSLDADYAATQPGLTAGNYTMIEISDTGTGMPPEVLRQIFEPFFTTKEKDKGTGLGLSMVFGFMKQSGGHINVYSEVGIGTTFRLYLPRAGVVEETRAPPEIVALERGGNETVLAVEDNVSLRRVVTRQLKELGYRLLEAADGQDAMRILEKEKVDLLFTDIVMPGGMSGYDLARMAAARWPAIRVVLTSGFPDVKLNGNGDTPSGMRLLSKPYRKADLARTLREVLDA